MQFRGIYFAILKKNNFCRNLFWWFREIFSGINLKDTKYLNNKVHYMDPFYSFFTKQIWSELTLADPKNW